VLPPNPDDGAAPRIGYFPDDTVARITDIQRLKREGWSISRIAARFAGLSGAEPNDRSSQPAPAPAPAPVAPGIAGFPRQPVRPDPTPGRTTLALADIPHPAYLLDRGLDLVWSNEAARANPASPLHRVAPDGAPGSVAQQLLGHAGEPGAGALLRFHLGLLKQRGVPFNDVARGVPADQVAALEASFRACAPVSAEPFAQLYVPAADGGLLLQAAQFREGILFVLVPATEQQAVLAEPRSPRAAAATHRPAPALMPVAVLMATLQDAHALWLRLPAVEYFELVNEVWTQLDAIFRDLGGRHSSHPGEGMVCYFLPAGDDGYLAHALTAALRVREAMRQLSSRWQARKGWDVELCMNTGIDAGQDWIGPLRLAEPVELSVLGAAADHAGALSRTARGGAIWITRGLVDRLGAAERQRLQYGVPRRGSEPGQPRVLASFARLQDLAGSAAVPPALAGLPVTELFELALPGPTRNPGQASA
jgi:class 3 adenylate cyclase